MLLFLTGSTEMFLTFCIYYGIYLIPLKPDQEPIHINNLLFVIGVTIEATFLIFSLIILNLIYIKTYGSTNKTCTNAWIISSRSLFQILPSDMLIFFGYAGHHTFEQVLLNLSWLRRIFSSIRIIIQMAAFESLINGEFVTLVVFVNFLYLTLLLVAICPQASHYD